MRAHAHDDRRAPVLLLRGFTGRLARRARRGSRADAGLPSVPSETCIGQRRGQRAAGSAQFVDRRHLLRGGKRKAAAGRADVHHGWAGCDLDHPAVLREHCPYPTDARARARGAGHEAVVRGGDELQRRYARFGTARGAGAVLDVVSAARVGADQRERHPAKARAKPEDRDSLGSTSGSRVEALSRLALDRVAATGWQAGAEHGQHGRATTPQVAPPAHPR